MGSLCLICTILSCDRGKILPVFEWRMLALLLTLLDARLPCRCTVQMQMQMYKRKYKKRWELCIAFKKTRRSKRPTSCLYSSLYAHPM